MEIEKLNITTRTKNALEKKGIYTTWDMAHFKPRRYIAYETPVSISAALAGEYQAVKAKLLSVQRRAMKARRQDYLFLRMQSEGSYANTFNVMIFGVIYQHAMLASMEGQEVVVCGKVIEDDFYGKSMTDITKIVKGQEYEPFLHMIYPSIRGVSMALRDRLIASCVEANHEVVEEDVRDLMPHYGGEITSCYNLHYAKNEKDFLSAKRTQILNDLLYFSMGIMEEEKVLKSPFHFSSWEKSISFSQDLPFALTQGEGSQQEVLNHMMSNAKNHIRNNVLLQGDVGCGKTIIAAIMMMFACENGYQSVLMAPKTILAQQHFDEISSYADRYQIPIVFLRSGMKAKEKREALAKIKIGEAKFIVGTHSVVAEDVVYKNLALVICDEEHLFGVKVKEALRKKAKEGVHFISMSATPIPRSLANALYADSKDIMTITKKPSGRLPILTSASAKREDAFLKILDEVKKGRQAYVVCPAIEETENPNFKIVSIEEVAPLYQSFFSKHGIRLGVVNGKQKKEEAKKEIEKFIAGETQILMSTTVIEVGVNVPNTTVMVIEQADRFGLASLHQLRGRVGRNSMQSFCILLCENPDQNPRVQVMCKTNDGFVIAQEDMELRGTGDLFGLVQAGQNKFVEEMLSFPSLFEEAKKAAKYALREGKCKFLLDAYENISGLG